MIMRSMQSAQICAPDFEMDNVGNESMLRGLLFSKRRKVRSLRLKLWICYEYNVSTVGTNHFRAKIHII